MNDIVIDGGLTYVISDFVRLDGDDLAIPVEYPSCLHTTWAVAGDTKPVTAIDPQPKQGSPEHALGGGKTKTTPVGLGPVTSGSNFRNDSGNETIDQDRWSVWILQLLRLRRLLCELLHELLRLTQLLHPSPISFNLSTAVCRGGQP